MDEILFNLNDPLEKKVNDRLEEYMKSGKPFDKVFDMIVRDFPYMSMELVERCEHKAYRHFFMGEDGRPVATVKHVAIMHNRLKYKSLYSQKETFFRLYGSEEDLLAAVHVENPAYPHEKAEVHLSFYVNDGDKKLNEFKHTMEAHERSNVYYVPLNVVKECCLLCGKCKHLEFTVVNENVGGQVVKTAVDVYNYWAPAPGTFEVEEAAIRYKGSSVNRDVFYLDSISALEMYVLLKADYGIDANEFDVTVTLCPVETQDGDTALASRMFFCTTDPMDYYCCEFEGFHTLFKVRESYAGNESIPVYVPRPGKYVIELCLWGQAFWSKEIEIAEGADEEYDKEMDEDLVCGLDDEAPMSIPSLDGPEDDSLDDSPAQKMDSDVEEHDDEAVKDTPESRPVQEGNSGEPAFNPTDYIEVLGLALYNISSDEDDDERCLDGISSLPQTSFAAEKLKMLSVIGKYKVIRHNPVLDDEAAFMWFLYDQTGRLVGNSAVRTDNVMSDVWVSAPFGSFCAYKWQMGTYRLELQLKSETVISATFNVGEIDVCSDYDPKLISRRPASVVTLVEGGAIARLEKMAGLKDIKEKIHSMMNFHKLQKLRSQAGLPVKHPSLHARFLGNPGTGKTTVARLLGQIYKEMGLLSSGHVVLEERKNMIGRYYDSEGQAVENALNRAKGGILLIDEAYNLYVKDDEKDPGRRILEYLLTALSDEENRDWMLILAGYPDEMEAMLESNPGIKSRVNECFVFEDFSVDELMEIAALYCDDNSYELSEEARERLRSVVSRDVAAKDKHFGNGRYVNKLMETAINSRMATRISKIESPTYDQLVTIEADDIPITAEEAERISSEGFDETAIDEALKRLDSMVGLAKVKSAIHNFVNISRYLNSQGERYRGKGLLKWNFTGNTGTGKSTVAQILADILKAMNLVQNNEVTEVKGEEIFNVSDYECNEVIRAAVKRSRKGVLFIDGDAPEFRPERYRLTSEQVRFKLAALAAEDNSSGALIIAECTTPNLSIAHSLASNGIYDFDHTFIFDDYTADELYSILLQCLAGYKVSVSGEAEAILKEYIGNLCANRGLAFANARTMKNLSRAIFETLILRMTHSSGTGNERVVEACDVESFVWRRDAGKLGF